jgi:hypothetical protein
VPSSHELLVHLAHGFSAQFPPHAAHLVPAFARQLLDQRRIAEGGRLAPVGRRTQKSPERIPQDLATPLWRGVTGTSSAASRKYRRSSDFDGIT